MTKRKSKTTGIPKPKTWTKTTLPMKPGHTWKAPDGYKIVVADRGLVSFSIPSEWTIQGFEPLDIRDKEPPDETCHLVATIFRTPPGVDWTELPLTGLMKQVTENAYKDVWDRTPIQKSPREDIEFVWFQQTFMDPEEHRPAHSRIAMARGLAVHVLFTFDYWVEDAPKLEPIWSVIMDSILLDRYIEDPTRGETLH